MDEEDVAREIAEALEMILDIDEIELPEGSRTINFALDTGERFKVRVTRIEDEEADEPLGTDEEDE